MNVDLKAPRRSMKSNGWPSYWENVPLLADVIKLSQLTGFPNKQCPNAPAEQSYNFDMKVPDSSVPDLNVTVAIGTMAFGVAANGVPFDPYANLVDPKTGWTKEVLTGKTDLGTDLSNGHVQPGGAYHYHGMPTLYLKELVELLDPTGRPTVMGSDMTLLGYAADGYPIYSCYVRKMNAVKPGEKGGPTAPLYTITELKSRWRLKSGLRGKGEPPGSYDGTYTNDFSYDDKNPGDLDQCNGKWGVTPENSSGTYYYVITRDFPFIPRYWRETPSSSFHK